MTDRKILLRKLFFSLHMFPWLLLVCSFFVIFFLLYMENINLRMSNDLLLSSEISMSFSNGYLFGKGEIYKEAIDSGYGEWYISDNLGVNFRWLELGDSVRSVSLVEISNNVDNISHVFSRKDYELSNRLGMDLEGDLGSGILLLIENSRARNAIIITESDYHKLRLDILHYIGVKFAGFKTYNSID